MRIQIDTIQKIIKIEHEVNLGKLVKALSKLLPNNEWKTYKLENFVMYNGYSPFYIQPIYVHRPITGDFVITSGTSDTKTIVNTADIVSTSCVLNVEFN